MKPVALSRFVALLLATNYFAFQVELFEDEYEANHRPVSETSAIGSPTLTWESFDKTNAPKAFVFNAEITFHFLHRLEPAVLVFTPPVVCFNPIRDKSPPPFSLHPILRSL
jgi:hypothetical protein